MRLLFDHGAIKIRVLSSNATGTKRHLGIEIVARSGKRDYPKYLTIDRESSSDQDIYQAIELAVLTLEQNAPKATKKKE